MKENFVTNIQKHEGRKKNTDKWIQIKEKEAFSTAPNILKWG